MAAVSYIPLIIGLNVLILCGLTIRMQKQLSINYSTYKITNYLYTYGVSLLYLIFAVIFLLFLRVIRIIYPINLYKIYVLLSEFLQKCWLIPGVLKFVILLDICLFLYLFFLFLVLLHKFCKTEIIKLHLYHLEKGRLYCRKPENHKISIYRKFVIFFGLKASLFCFYLNISKGLQYLGRFFPSLLKIEPVHIATTFELGPFLLLLGCFLYDILFNNFFLIITALYLPIYFLFTLYIRYSYFINFQNMLFNAILFERYYCYPQVVILICPLDPDLEIYIKKRLYYPESFLFNYDGSENLQLFQLYYRFEKHPYFPAWFVNRATSIGLLRHNLICLDLTRYNTKTLSYINASFYNY